jgi:hypothetical protein
VIIATTALTNSVDNFTSDDNTALSCMLLEQLEKGS